MKTVIGISHFFKQNTPKFWQIIGDIGALVASISACIMMLETIMQQSGFTNFVLPIMLACVNKWCLAIGAMIKFITKFIGKKEVAASTLVSDQPTT